MADATFYRFYRTPRFSANHIAEYLSTTDANQREAVIRKAKFPRTLPVIAYQQVTPHIRRFLTSNSGDMTIFDGIIETLQQKALSPDEGYERDEARRCLAAIEAFKATFVQMKLGRIMFQPGPSDVAMKVESVTINSRLDPPLVESGRGGATHSGGIVLLLAASPDARKDIAARTKTVAAIVHWALESAASNVTPHPRLCMSFDAFGGQVVRAPDSYTNLRRRISASCREVAGNWDRVGPPSGYDGPEWR